MSPPLAFAEESPLEEDDGFAGYGDEEYPGFPVVNAPSECPDLSRHFATMTRILRNDPELYTKLHTQKTQMGVTFAKCIKTGIDNKGHKMVKTVGMVAGDEESYETFSELFNPVIALWHQRAHPTKHPTDLDLSKLTSTRCDPTGKYVHSVNIQTTRNLRGLRLSPAMSEDERCEAERVVVKALSQLNEPLKGEYFSFEGSSSNPSQTVTPWMSRDDEEELTNKRLLFDAPDAPLLLSSGFGRHWPNARGVFVNVDKSFVVWMNEVEHIRAISVQKGDNVQEAFSQIVTALDQIETSLKESPERYEFMHNEHLGYVTSCPSNLGTGLSISVTIEIPLLAAEPWWRDWVVEQRLKVRSASKDGLWLPGLFEVSNRDVLGMSEVALCNHVIECVANIVAMEAELEGSEIDQGNGNSMVEKHFEYAPLERPAVSANQHDAQVNFEDLKGAELEAELQIREREADTTEAS